MSKVDTYYDRWRELQAEAFGGPCEPDYPGLDHDIDLAIENGIGALESWLHSETTFDDGAGIVTEYDAGELEQAEWFLGVAWDSLAEREGVESDAFNEQGRS